MNNKIIEYQDIEQLVKVLHNKKTVIAGGCFDILHYGHVKFLEQARKEGDVLIVVLESDDFIKKNKQKVPVHTQQQRAEILAAQYSVDYVLKIPLFNSNEDYFKMVSAIKPSIIAVSEGDSKIDKKQKQADLINAKVKIVSPLLKNFSSSKIISYESIFSD